MLGVIRSKFVILFKRFSFLVRHICTMWWFKFNIFYLTLCWTVGLEYWFIIYELMPFQKPQMKLVCCETIFLIKTSSLSCPPFSSLSKLNEEFIHRSKRMFKSNFLDLLSLLGSITFYLGCGVLISFFPCCCAAVFLLKCLSSFIRHKLF